MYEAAVALVALSSSATAVRASAQCFCQLLATHSDNNVKLIVIDQLNMLKKRHRKVLQELVIDILRALAIPNVDIRKRALSIATDLLSPQNIDSVMLKLKKELRSSQDEQGATEYRAQLVAAIHNCAVKFPEVAGSVVHVLIEVLSGTTDGAAAVVQFVRDILQTYPALRADILGRLLDLLPAITQGSVLEVAMWIFGEYCEDVTMIGRAFEAIQASLGGLPLTGRVTAGSEDKNEESTKEAEPSARGPTVLADGTYASQSSVGTDAPAAHGGDDNDEPALRRLLKKGDLLLANSLCCALTKMVLRVFKARGEADSVAKQMAVKVLQIICAVLELGQTTKMSDTTVERLRFCIKTLLDPVARKMLSELWLGACRESFGDLMKLKSEAMAKAAQVVDEEEKQHVSPDHLITFRHLCGAQRLNVAIDLDDDFDLGNTGKVGAGNKDLSRLDRMYQLTGFGDPVYAEAMITVHDYDIVLEITILNRTDITLHNLTVELATMGDLKLVERPQNYTIGPKLSQEVKASIKVSSTETGHVFGSIVYDVEQDGGDMRQVMVNLQDIHIDIMDYIHSSTCSDNEFRMMWAEFEWENKVAVNTNIIDVDDFLQHIMSITNMNCLTPAANLTGTCNFLAANLYARSVFGEDALLNLSVEKRVDTTETKLVGFMRIRSKTQGIALSLGDRIQAKQRGKQQSAAAAK